VVDQTLTVREAILQTLKENLVMAQKHMKQQADQGRSKHQFEEGDQVFLCLQHYKQNSLKVEHCQKLAPKFYGPYIVLKHVGQMAYQLAFPSHSMLHLVFHVSYLKKVIGTNCQIQTNLPKLVEEGSIWL
jgi:MarR-like DNA-binding transcriptional regulator SgrR of sgrS sRNA